MNLLGTLTYETNSLTKCILNTIVCYNLLRWLFLLIALQRVLFYQHSTPYGNKLKYTDIKYVQHNH